MQLNEPQLAIKRHFRLLVLANGGPVNAALILNAQHSHISEAMSPNWPQRMPRADHVMMLEAAFGEPHVTRFMAGATDHDLKPREAADANVARAFAEAVKEMMDVPVSYSAAIADGGMDAEEAQALSVQADEAIARLAAFKAALREGS